MFHRRLVHATRGWPVAPTLGRPRAASAGPGSGRRHRQERDRRRRRAQQKSVGDRWPNFSLKSMESPIFPSPMKEEIMRWAESVALGLAATTVLAAPVGLAQPGPRLQEGPFSERFDGRVGGGDASRTLEYFRTRRPPRQCAVTLDVFSGRRNPTSPMSRKQSVELFKRLQTMGPAPAYAAGASGGLGYRGVVIRCPTDPQMLPIRVLCGVVSIGNEPASPPVGYVDGLDRRLVLSAPREARIPGMRALATACGL
jgi:hypothetical protein